MDTCNVAAATPGGPLVLFKYIAEREGGFCLANFKFWHDIMKVPHAVLCTVRTGQELLYN
jgi:hypothetical protein